MGKVNVYARAELDLICQHYPNCQDPAELLPFLPGRTARGIDVMARRMGLRSAATSAAYLERVNGYSPGERVIVEERLDRLHVKACLAQGGFPAAEVVNGRTVWVWPMVSRQAGGSRQASLRRQPISAH